VLGGGRDESVGGRACAQINGTERGDAQRARRTVLRTPAIEHGFDLAQRLFALASGQPLDCSHILRARAENAHALGAAQFDAGQ
jgi:hypothetical protein